MIFIFFKQNYLLIKSVSTYIQIFLLNSVAQNVIADTQIKLFKKIINADLAWLHRIHSAKIISNFLYIQRAKIIILNSYTYIYLRFTKE